ncbi:thiol:disulfide interchange protein DsbA/DsbL [Campylobacter majalis]|uniref:thiol:disulfide interchange protein DsbA/DsbL n=1 Tax=Campylobacter majalis TaxID=2790656 RepID=UPI003D69A947
MKKLIVKFTAILAIIVAPLVAYEEGVDYIRLQRSLPVERGTLTKVFSYACPYCYKYDKSVIPKVMSKLDGVKFIPYHLKTKGELGNSVSEIFAVLIAIDNENGIDLLSDESKFKKAKFAIYKAYHDNGERWSNGKNKDDFLNQILSVVGVSTDEFEKRLKDFSVITMLSDWDNGYAVAQLQGVPALVVDGRYLINTQNIRSLDDLARLITKLQSHD